MAILITSILHTIVGVVCVKVFAIVETGFNFENAGNMSIYGAIFFLPIFYYIGSKIFKKDMAVIFDVFTICVLATLICARFNCIFSGCCLGRCVMENSSITWPTRELEIVFYIILILILKKQVYKGKTKGEAFPIYMIAYGIFRFIIEWFRVGEAVIFGVFHRAHLWSLVSILIGCLVLVYVIPKKQKNTYRKRGVKRE